MGMMRTRIAVIAVLLIGVIVAALGAEQGAADACFVAVQERVPNLARGMEVGICGGLYAPDNRTVVESLDFLQPGLVAFFAALIVAGAVMQFARLRSPAALLQQ